MNWSPHNLSERSNTILAALDECAGNWSFPMLDNGYVYLAASRLALFRTPAIGPLSDWALVIEVFGFSPRTGQPDIGILTFASKLNNRNAEGNYVTAAAYENYLTRNPHNEHRSVFPVDLESSLDPENSELIAESARFVEVRGQQVAIPQGEGFGDFGIALAQPPRIQVFEMCRYLAETHREQILATPSEQRVSIPPEMQVILQLEEWHHPDLASGERPSQCQTFQQLAEVLIKGDTTLYRPALPPNTHWRNWPDGGAL